ncbi:DUF2306 domain-containing protein [Chloroflexi bacterium TSY]|nr:DUF2306 domain-containing protein [Chloroflexi bacterium TSY]
MSTLGLVHTVLALMALGLGALVLARSKSGRWHRSLGHLYFGLMVAMNMTGLFMTQLFGGFGPFHWMAVATLIILAAGISTVLLRWPAKGWRKLHGHFMAASYVALVAGAGAEVGSRLPGVPRGMGIIVPSVLIVAIGIYLIITRIEPTQPKTV